MYTKISPFSDGLLVITFYITTLTYIFNIASDSDKR